MSLKADACPHTLWNLGPSPWPPLLQRLLGDRAAGAPLVEMCCDVSWRTKQQAKNQPLGLVVCYLLPLIHFSLFGSSNQNELIWDFQAVGCFSSGSFLLSSGLWGLAAI